MECILSNVSRGTIDRLRNFQDILKKWNKSLNLVSQRDVNNIWDRHIKDSVQIVRYISGKKILDIGSGGGFPAIILAICLPELEVHLVESDIKKTIFLKEVSRILSLNTVVHQCRVESFPLKGFDLITARAFSSLDRLLEVVYLHGVGSGIFLKGKTVQEEIDEAQKKWEFGYELISSQTDPSGRILKIFYVKEHKND